MINNIGQNSLIVKSILRLYRALILRFFDDMKLDQSFMKAFTFLLTAIMVVPPEGFADA